MTAPATSVQDGAGPVASPSVAGTDETTLPSFPSAFPGPDCTPR